MSDDKSSAAVEIWLVIAKLSIITAAMLPFALLGGQFVRLMNAELKLERTELKRLQTLVDVERLRAEIDQTAEEVRRLSADATGETDGG